MHHNERATINQRGQMDGGGGGSSISRNHPTQIQHQYNEASILNDIRPKNYYNNYNSNNRPHANSLLNVPFNDNRIEELISGNFIYQPEKLYELKKLADYPSQWNPKSLINVLEKICDASHYKCITNDTMIILELHLRTFAAVLEVLVQSHITLSRDVREKLYKQLTEFNDLHHRITVVSEQGLNKTWKGKLEHLNLNVADVELQPGGVKRNYNIDFLLIHLRDTLHGLSDDETKFREGWRRAKDFFRGVLGITPALTTIAIPAAPCLADNAGIPATWMKMRDAFGFKIPISSWYKDWRLLLTLKQTLDTSCREANNQNLKKFGERMILEYLWFHVKQLIAKIPKTNTSKENEESDFEFSKSFNNKKRLFAELCGTDPVSYPNCFWFGILDLAGIIAGSSTKSVTMSLCYYLALESLDHSPSTFIRFKAIELLLSLEHRRRDWFAVVDVDLNDYSNRYPKKKLKFVSLVDFVKCKLALDSESKERGMSEIIPNPVDDFPPFNIGAIKSNSSILSLLAQELLCPVTLQITDRYYALECGHPISVSAFNIYKSFQNKSGKVLACTVCRAVINEESLILLPQDSTLNALSDRLIAAGLLSHDPAMAVEFEIVSDNGTEVTDIKKPPINISEGVSRQFTTVTDPPDPLQRARDCYKQNPQKGLLILDKTLQNKSDSPQAWLLRSKIYDYLNRYGESLHDVKKAIQYDSYNFDAYQHRAQLHFKMKNYKDSFTDISIVINRIETRKNEVEGIYKYTINDLDAYELRGNVCVKLGDFYKKAISDFTIVLENSENLSIASLANRGSLYREIRQYKEALEDLIKAIRYNPNYTFAIAQRGSVYCKMDRFSEALEDLDFILNNHNASEEEKSFAVSERGGLFCKQNKFDEALKDLNSALEQNQYNSYARSRRGYALFMLKKYDESLKDLNKVLTLDKTNYYALTYRGMIYKQLHDYKKGLEDFNTVLNYYPNNSVTLRQRAIVYFHLGKYEESVSDFDKLLSLNVNDWSALCYRADILCELGRYRDSLEDCDKILQFDSSNLSALRIRGTVLRKFGQNNKALADLDKVLSQEPDNAVALHERAAVYTALHQYPRALSDCERIFFLKPKESISTFRERTKVYGELSEAVGVEEILIHLERVLQDSPRNALALTTRAYIHLLQWKCDKAIYDLNCALEFQPNFILSLYQRSVIYRITQNYANALKDLEKILELEPGNNFARTERSEIKSMKDFDKSQFHTPSENRSRPPRNHLVSRSSESSFDSSISSLSISTSETSNMSSVSRSGRPK